MMGIAGIIGAFAAGIAISQTEYKHEVEHKIEPIAYAIFVPVFFVSIGMEITFQGIGSQLWFIIIMTLIAIFTKLIGSGLGARLTGFNLQSSISIGAGMVSRGEVALIIAANGLTANLLAKRKFHSDCYCCYIDDDYYAAAFEEVFRVRGKSLSEVGKLFFIAKSNGHVA